MSSRLKSLGFSKRKNSNNNLPPSQVPSPPKSGAYIAPPSSTASTSSPPPDGQQNSSSNTSLVMTSQNHPGRPPSYSYNPAGRPTSPVPPGGPQQLTHHHPPPPQINPAALQYIQSGPPPPLAPPPGYGYQQPMHSLPPTLAPHQPPPPRNPVEVEGSNRKNKAQLIVGIDFGTTFSGVAFAFATNNEAREDIITEWPGAGTHTKQKIPTVLYYDQYQKVVGWGPDIADALAPTGYPKPGVQKVEWFKLQLMTSGNTYVDPINLPPLPPGKSEIDVAADYLFKLRQAMRAQLQKTLGEVFTREERNIRYFLTVPAIWNDAAKAATRQAALQAGFLRDENDNRLTLITEPEAAAMFCAKTGLLNLKVGDAILIVDCGGGTVDLIAYEVEDENPFTVSECTAGSGDSCGSTALNRNFSNILRAKIRKMKLPDGSRTAGKVYAKCIMDFENRIKADFRNNGQKWAVDVGIEADFPEAGIEEGYMTFTNEEILQCFEPVVNRILELVRNQIIAIQAQNRSLQVSLTPLTCDSYADWATGVECAGRGWIWCVGISLPTDQAARAAAVPIQGGATHGLGCGDREGSRDGRYLGAGDHAPGGAATLPDGDVAAVQGGIPSGAVPGAESGRQGPVQVHEANLCAEGRAGEDWRAGQGQLFPAGRAGGDPDVRGHSVCV